MVKRAMDPAKGSWCFPGGFMELFETPPQTAIRECKEESGFDIEITGLIDVFYYEDYRGSGVLIMYRGEVIGGHAEPGEDADDVGFFGPDALPENIVFDTNLKTLALWREGKL
jgi:ADP-ribose pyrophosphatase YjhB (NUDIX family)